jgi:hypothetical protein
MAKSWPARASGSVDWGWAAATWKLAAPLTGAESQRLGRCPVLGRGNGLHPPVAGAGSPRAAVARQRAARLEGRGRRRRAGQCSRNGESRLRKQEAARGAGEQATNPNWPPAAGLGLGHCECHGPWGHDASALRLRSASRGRKNTLHATIFALRLKLRRTPGSGDMVPGQGDLGQPP